MTTHPVLIAGQWRAARAGGVFHGENPATGEALPDEFPVSTWADCDAVLAAAQEVAPLLRAAPPEQIADFLTRYAARIEKQADAMIETAHLETGLAKSPRLANEELPRTAGNCGRRPRRRRRHGRCPPSMAREISARASSPSDPWRCSARTISHSLTIAFPEAISRRRLPREIRSLQRDIPRIRERRGCWRGRRRRRCESGLPPSTVQMVYHIANDDGLRLIADRRLAALGFTGSRAAGLRLKAAADAAGKPAYLEMSSLNPVLILPGAPGTERGDRRRICIELPRRLRADVYEARDRPALQGGTERCVHCRCGREIRGCAGGSAALRGGGPCAGSERRGIADGRGAARHRRECAGRSGMPICEYAACGDGGAFLAESEKLQTEAFGNASLCVIVDGADQAASVLARFDGNLTGGIYSDSRGADDALYARLAPLLRARVGRFLNDKMPTGVAVSPAMNHGGPFPATGHPGFTSVGIPASMRRFAMLACYDNVRASRLPVRLRDF